ncbi:phage holin family protein [Geodermatophilus ruber]|uniref:Putative Holin-X, holin superfamily III n=1 Tax=Geodermatophilus ruber TaxID=504800 RepID=A0A1I4DA22_9ACTN|nr:phage holin family protein [Geodermatophilus ruber]SFK89739.1 Putative Holin-X, holin superfamily III [Geodermatophilus ruber]
MAHSASSTPPPGRPVGAEEPSIGVLVQSAMADMSTLIRAEIELAKAEMGRSAKKAGIGAGAFGTAGVLLGVSTIFLFITIAEFLTWLGLQRWISYLIVWAFFVLLAAIAAVVGRGQIKKIEKPERTMETLRELPAVVHREAPGQRRREVPTVSSGRVQLRGSDQYSL